MKLYITEPDTIDAELIESILPDQYEVVRGTTSFDGDDTKDCSGLIIRSATTVGSSVKEAFPKLECVIRVGTGVDNIDIDFCNKHGIAVYNAPGANADAASDYVIGMMFYALRKTYLLTRQDIEAWNRFKFIGHSMAGRTIGIIGFGNIGRMIFGKLKSFNCRAFLVYDPLIKASDMPEGATYIASINDILRNSDIVTLHVPLLPSTRYLINRDNLSLMRQGAILMNASRGGVVNETDVVAYMQSHDLVYIADTVEGEPNVSKELLNEPNVVVTPHIASLTEESDMMMVKMALDNFLNGRTIKG